MILDEAVIRAINDVTQHEFMPALAGYRCQGCGALVNWELLSEGKRSEAAFVKAFSHIGVLCQANPTPS